MLPIRSSAPFGRRRGDGFRKNRMAMAGLVFLSILVVIAVVTLVIDLVTQNEIYNNYVINQDLVSRLQGPSLQHPLGQDEFGRDMLLRMLWGTRYSLFMGSLAIIFSLCVGGVLGALSGFYGKLTDSIIMRIMDVLLAIPSMLLATAIVAALGTQPGQRAYRHRDLLYPHLCPDGARLRADGQGPGLYRGGPLHWLQRRGDHFQVHYPNAMAPIIVQATLGLAGAILSIAGLSFLGLGIQPPTPEWGAMLSNARVYMRDAWHVTVIPGLGIMLTILSLNLMGDGLRDALDPRLKN